MNKNQIQESSVAKEQRTIRKNFTEDEMNDLRENFAQNEIIKTDVEDEFSETKKSFKKKN